MHEFYEKPKMELISTDMSDDVITTSPGLETEVGGGGNDHQFGNN